MADPDSPSVHDDSTNITYINKNNNKNQQQMIGHGKEFQTKKVFFYQYFL